METHYFAKGYKCLKKDIVVRFLKALISDLKKETFYTEFESISSLFEVDVNTPQPNVENSIPVVEEPLKTKLAVDEYITDVLQIVLYRLVLLQYSRQGMESDKFAAKEYTYELLLLILTKEVETAIFYADLMLNLSRSYIDNDADSVLRGNNTARLSFKSSIASQEELVKLPYWKYIEEAISLIDDIYETEFYCLKLNEFLKSYGFGEADPGMRQMLSTNFNKIVWLKNGSFAGMVGLDVTTYLNLTIVENLYEKFKTDDEKKKSITAFIVATKLHEDAHHLVRIKQNNFLSLTPNKEKQWEAGYRFEIILFGAVITNFCEVGKIHTLEAWQENQKNVLLDKEDIKVQEADYENMNFYLSGICAFPTKIWIK